LLICVQSADANHGEENSCHRDSAAGCSSRTCTGCREPNWHCEATSRLGGPRAAGCVGCDGAVLAPHHLPRRPLSRSRCRQPGAVLGWSDPCWSLGDPPRSRRWSARGRVTPLGGGHPALPRAFNW